MLGKKKPLDGLFAQLQDIKDDNGNLLNTVLFSEKGDCSVIIEIENPVQQYCTDAEQYMMFTDVLNNIVQTLGEGYALQKQDIFCKQSYHHEMTEDMSYMMKSYFRHFEGRPYTEIQTYIIITQEAVKSTFVKYDPKMWADFHVKVSKVVDILKERGIWHHKLSRDEVDEYLHRFMAFQFRKGAFPMRNFKSTDEYLNLGDHVVKSVNLVDVDVINLPTYMKPYLSVPVNGFDIATDLLGFLSSIPDADCVVYNQVLQIPAQRKLLRKLQGKSKRHGSMPDPSNKIAKADIDAVLDLIAKENKLLVNTNFNILVSCAFDKLTPVSSYMEAKLYECGISPSDTAYNQLELFENSFPGNAYRFNEEYDLFMTLADTALCLFYKEHMKHSEKTPLKHFCTDRQGVPVAIDITGKTGEDKKTDNSNLFCLGSSGTGKSFNMNTILLQLIEQDTDVVVVDTGDSYEILNLIYGGTYITYSKEHPISMNPFKITAEEYNENFGEKKSFLKSLIFLIYKGNAEPTKIEDRIISQCIVEYYEEYFHPFQGYSKEERDRLRERLMLEDKMNGEYEKYEQKLEEKYSDDYRIDELEDKPENMDEKVSDATEDDEMDFTEEEKEHHEKVKRQVEKLHALMHDEAASDGEKAAANNQLMRLMPELIEGKYLKRIDKKIERMEAQRKKLRVKSLSFNTFYEFIMERIPQITSEKKIHFNINNFSSILEPFYRGGELEDTLNNDVDSSLFDARFIVFEIDKIKEDKTLFPIVVLIIMDVFLQKMRIKKGRKALIIEEAWKAISSPTMAEYIKYLYKTVRKFNGIAGVVTQELNDVIDSPIVKEAIISNSDIKILMDQSKFKDKYDEVAKVMGLTDTQRRQIFTINSMNNHEGRPYFKETWICRGHDSDVYGVEVPPEMCWAFTTERSEKEAVRLYVRYYENDGQRAIRQMEEDRRALGVGTRDFANMVNQHKTVMSLWES